MSKIVFKKLKLLSKKVIFLLSALVVALAGILIFAYFTSKPASASWFNEDWLYRKVVEITNSSGSNQTDFQVSFTLDTATLITAGKMQSSCNDIRLTDINGKLLYHWIEENNPGCNSATTKIWTKIPSIATSGQTIYVYYGNTSASGIEAPVKVFEFFDDFNQGSVNTSKWATSGSPTASSGVLNLSNSGALSSLSIVSDTTNTRTLGFRAKTTSTSVDTARLGFSNTSTLATSYYNDDSAHIVMGKEETYLANKGSTNLVSHHKLEETTSTDANQFKASGYLDTGKLSQAASVYGNAAGTSGSILTFNRGTQISGRNYERFNTNQGTISLWVKPSWNGNDGVEHDLLCSGNDCNVWFYKSTGNNLIFGVWDSTGGTYRSASVSISGWTSGTWYHVLARWDGDNVVSGSNYVELYINGSNTGVTNETTANSNAISPGKNNAIGARPDGSKSAQALIDDFAIFDRVLTTTEISNIYNSGTGREAGYVADSSLKFYAKMDGSGTLSPVTYNAGAAFDQTTYNSSTNTNGNLVADGNMEGADTSSWTASLSTLSKDTTAANVLYDTQVLKITNSGANWGRAQQAVTGLSAGDDFSFSIWGNNGTAGGIRIRVYSGTAASPTATTVFDKNTSSAGWVNFEGTVEVQAGHDRLTVEPLTNTNTDGQYSLWDNATLYKNLVNNGGMEGTYVDGVAPGWTILGAPTAAAETTTIHSGAESQKITTATSNEGVISPQVSTTAGNYYLLSAWVYAASGTVTIGRYDGTFPSTPSITSSTTGAWQKLALVFKADSGTQGRFKIAGGANTFYVDDVSIIPLDNTALSFQSWAPAADTATADNDLSVQGDSDGVASNTSGKYGNAYTFDGSTGYLRQKVYDIDIDYLSYEDTNTDIKDTGQEFGDWDNDSGAAEYMIVVTNSDNTTSWGYFCANDAGTQTAVYTLKACTGGSEGFNGTSPSGKTPVGYEIRKSDYQITGALTMGAWIKTSDTQGRIMSKQDANNFSYDIYAYSTAVGFRLSQDGTTARVDIGSSTNPLDNNWHFIVATTNGSNSHKVYIDGVERASSTTSVTIADTAAAFIAGGGINGWYTSGSIDSPFVIADDLTAAQVKELYNASSSKYTYINNNNVTNTITESATAMDTDYHTFEISQAASSVLYSIDGAAATTVSTNPPDASEYIRLENTDASNAVNVDYVYVRKYVATAPSAGSPGSEEKGKGPITYWKFDEGQGTIAKDSTSNKNNSTFINNASWQTEDQCISGKCVKMPADTDYLRLPASAGNALNLGSSDFTIMGWLKVFQPETYGSGLLGNYPHAGNNGDLSIGISDDRTTLFLNHRNTSGTYESYGGFNYSSYFGKWVQMSWVKSGSSLYLYLNGEKKKTWDITISFDVDFYDDYWYIGNTGWSPGTMSNLMVDEHKIYNYARTAAEIKTDYNAGKANATANSGTSAALGSQPQEFMSQGLVGYWKMDESSGNATDYSGNSLTLTNNSTMAYGTGKFGNAATGDGTADFLNTATTISSVQTIAFWVNPANSTDNYINLTGSTVYINSSSGTVSATGVTSPSIYVNGALNGTVTASAWNHIVITTTSAISASQFEVGRANSAYAVSGSKLDEVRLYNRALSSKEVSDLYNWAPGPVGYWKMDDKVSGDSKTIVDTSTSGNNALTVDGANNTGMDCTKIGKYGGACEFDGTDDYLADTSFSGLTDSPLTMEAWIYPTAMQDSLIVEYGTSGGTADFFLDILSSTQKWRYVKNGIGSVSSNSTVQLNKWTHVAVVEDPANSVKLYINGVLENSGTVTLSHSGGSNSIYVGARGGGSMYFKGRMDNVQVYNYGRTAKQIVEDMNGGHPAVGTPVGSAVGHWKFDEGQGTTANDSTINANTLTLSSASWTNAGKFGKAWNGTGALWASRADDADFDFAATDSFAVSLWYKTDSANNPGATEYLLNKGPVAASAAGYAIYANASGNLCFAIDDDTTWDPDITSCTTTDLYDGAWHHVIGIRDVAADKTYIYIDGVLKDSDTDTTSATLANSSSLYIGDSNGADGGDEFNGDIDEVKIYRFALTPDQVKTEFNRGQSMQLGALGTNSTYAAGAANQEYCVPGDTTSCAPPLAEYDFEEKNGTSTSDRSGNGYTGTLVGATWTSGKKGSGLFFDGASATKVSSAAPVSTNFTWEVWLYRDTTWTSGEREMMSREYQTQFTVNGNNVLRLQAGGNGSALGTTTIVPGRWYHAAVTYDGTTVKVYLNGVLEGQNNITVNDGTATLYTGWYDTSGTYNWKGKLDQVKVFNYARTPAQIAYDYNRGGPVGWWKMDECQGDRVNDSSGNGNNGTITIGGSGSQSTGGTCTTPTDGTGAWYNGATGKRNSSLNFDGTDDYINIADNSVLRPGSGDWSVSIWAKPANSDQTSMMVGKRQASGDYEQWGMSICGESGCSSGGQQLQAIFRTSGTSERRALSSADVADGNWHHYIMVVNQSDNKIKLYKDGTELAATLTTTGSWPTVNNTDALRIGDGNGSLGFSGQVDDVRVFNYALTGTQIKDVYNNGAVNFGPVTGSP